MQVYLKIFLGFRIKDTADKKDDIKIKTTIIRKLIFTILQILLNYSR